MENPICVNSVGAMQFAAAATGIDAKLLALAHAHYSLALLGDAVIGETEQEGESEAASNFMLSALTLDSIVNGDDEEEEEEVDPTNPPLTEEQSEELKDLQTEITAKLEEHRARREQVRELIAMAPLPPAESHFTEEQLKELEWQRNRNVHQPTPGVTDDVPPNDAAGVLNWMASKIGVKA